MKPKHTWIVIANARIARIIEHRGTGSGLFASPDMVLHAEPAGEYSDRPGTGKSIAGPATPTVEMSDLQQQADLAFAHEISARLLKGQRKRSYDRLIIIASPHMLGLLRKSYHADFAEMIMAELDKDLTSLPLPELKKHIQTVLLV